MEPPTSKSLKSAAAEICSCLPEELLDCIFKSFNHDDGTFKSLSVVSKQFLSITNRLRFSATITDETIPFLPRLFHRFPNLSSLNLTLLSKAVEDILTLISTFPLDIKSLNLPKSTYIRPIPIPANGLIALSKTMKNLKSLTCYRMSHVDKKDLFFIADCFPSLEELNLSYPWLTSNHNFLLDYNESLLALPNLRKINLSGNYITDKFIDFLRHNCKLLQEITVKGRISRGFGIYGKYDSSDIIYL